MEGDEMELGNRADELKQHLEETREQKWQAERMSDIVQRGGFVAMENQARTS